MNIVYPSFLFFSSSLIFVNKVHSFLCKDLAHFFGVNLFLSIIWNFKDFNSCLLLVHRNTIDLYFGLHTVTFLNSLFFFFTIWNASSLFIYLFMAVLGLRFCARAFSSCGKRGPLFIAVRGPLIIAVSLVAEHRLQTRRLSNCGSRAQLLRGMWDLPRPGLEPVSPALAGRFSITAPPGKP